MRNKSNNDVYSKVVRAGKRTYFFDVKATKGNDLYLILTESKKTSDGERDTFEKHKLFLYKEDFFKFQEGLRDVLNKISKLKFSEKNTAKIEIEKEEESYEFGE